VSSKKFTEWANEELPGFSSLLTEQLDGGEYDNVLLYDETFKVDTDGIMRYAGANEYEGGFGIGDTDGPRGNIGYAGMNTDKPVFSYEGPISFADDYEIHPNPNFNRDAVVLLTQTEYDQINGEREIKLIDDEAETGVNLNAEYARYFGNATDGTTDKTSDDTGKEVGHLQRKLSWIPTYTMPYGDEQGGYYGPMFGLDVPSNYNKRGNNGLQLVNGLSEPSGLFNLDSGTVDETREKFSFDVRKNWHLNQANTIGKSENIGTKNLALGLGAEYIFNGGGDTKQDAWFLGQATIFVDADFGNSTDKRNNMFGAVDFGFSQGGINYNYRRKELDPNYPGSNLTYINGTGGDADTVFYEENRFPTYNYRYGRASKPESSGESRFQPLVDTPLWVHNYPTRKTRLNGSFVGTVSVGRSGLNTHPLADSFYPLGYLFAVGEGAYGANTGYRQPFDLNPQTPITALNASFGKCRPPKAAMIAWGAILWRMKEAGDLVWEAEYMDNTFGAGSGDGLRPTHPDYIGWDGSDPVWFDMYGLKDLQASFAWDDNDTNITNGYFSNCSSTNLPCIAPETFDRLDMASSIVYFRTTAYDKGYTTKCAITNDRERIKYPNLTEYGKEFMFMPSEFKIKLINKFERWAETKFKNGILPIIDPLNFPDNNKAPYKLTSVNPSIWPNIELVGPRDIDPSIWGEVYSSWDIDDGYSSDRYVGLYSVFSFRKGGKWICGYIGVDD
jgi:hypothetical protein